MIKEIDKITVSYGQKVTSNKLTKTTFKKVVDTIRNDQQIEGLTRKLQQLSDKSERQDFKKKNLPYFNMGTFESNVRSKNNLISSQHLLFDYDNLSEKELSEIRSKLKANGKVLCFFISPSGNGIKVIYKLDKSITDHKIFTDIYKHYAAKFKIKLGANPDNTSDAGRPCYFSYDPDIYINYAAEPLKTEVEMTIEKQQVMRSDRSSNKLEKIGIEGFDNILRGCSYVKNIVENASKGENINNADRLVLGNLLANFGEEGRAKLHEILSKVSNYKRKITDERLDDIIKLEYKPVSCEKNCGKVCEPVKVLNGKSCLSLAYGLNFIERYNCYYKIKNNSKGSINTEKITSFVIKPKELLVLPDKDCLVSNIQTAQNTKYENVLIENTDWHTKLKFLKALGHSDCVFLGTDRDLQLLCEYTNNHIPVKKVGTKVVGLINDDTWVIKNLNITKETIKKDVKIVPFDKGKEAFYNKIEYNLLSKDDYKDLVKNFYDTVLGINKQEIIIPWIAWLFVTPLKEQLKKTGEGFPLIFVHGSQGGGKTSTAKVLMRLCGYNISDPFSCTMRIFPMLKTLSSTNSIPVFLDEFKKADMREDQVDNLLRFMRKAYMGEVESKGRADQTTEDYYITAPICVMGEWNISQPALMERMLIVRFDGSVKKEDNMQSAFAKLKSLQLEGFMPEYIKFCLNQDVDELILESRNIIDKVFGDLSIAPRIKHNLSIMIIGLLLFERYAALNDISLVPFDYEIILKGQLKEITGSENGFVRSAVDQLLEELAVMVSIDHFKLSDYFIKVKLNKREVLAIRFNEIYPLFREHIKRRSFEGDLLDKESYKRLFKETDYVLKGREHQFPAVRFGASTHRALCIDVELAKKAELTLDGFDVT